MTRPPANTRGGTPAGEHDASEVLISAIEHYSYCPRQCALIHIEQTYHENAHTVRGQLAHKNVDSGRTETRPGIRTMRSIPLWSQQHGLRGKADVVEFPAGEPPYPVEHKVGRRRPPHADYQLCAQALCLEEMLGVDVPAGAIYSHAERRRHHIELDGAIRRQTLNLISAIRDQLARQQLPAAPDDARCPPCSLVHACLPSVAASPARVRGLHGALYRPLAPNTGDSE